jgi:hypothetical protein
MGDEIYRFVCPITNDICCEPVKAEDGRTYDKRGIEVSSFLYGMLISEPLLGRGVEATVC